MTIAAGLAEFCTSVASRPLPAVVEERARLCLADHLHAAIHGMRSETGERLVRYLALGETPQAPLRSEALALLLGSASTVDEIDDVHQDTSMHPGSVVVSAALGCLMEKPVSGKLLLAAIAAGYEVGIRLSIAAGERHYHYFHATATCGTLAAAATAAIILGLDREQTAHALGAAATSASGLWEDINDAAIGLKHLHSGFAAERGIRAAKLAKLGLRGARRSIEGGKGFLTAMARPGDFAPRETVPDEAALREMLLAGLGERWAILRNIYKRYPFCLACFEPLEGIRHIVARGGRPKEDVRSVAVDIYPPNASLIANPDPKDQLQAKFSAPFAIGLVLAGHDPEDVRLPKEWLVDPKVRGWYPSVSVRADNEIPRRHARVTVAWRDGAEESADRPLRNLDEKEVWGRFTSATRRYLGEGAREVEEAVVGCAAAVDTHGLAAAVRKALGV